MGSGILVICCSLLMPVGLWAQVPNRVLRQVDGARMRALPDHVPAWASARNDAGLAPAELEMEPVTLVLARSAEQEQALQQLLADQQNPASPEFHHWLTPSEMAERFGVSEADMGAVVNWLEAQGLRVQWTSPGRMFLGFRGRVGDAARAFQTEFHYYDVSGRKRLAPARPPRIPEALAPVVKAVAGLYMVEDVPFHNAGWAQAEDSPEMTSSSGKHFLTPLDFNVIYDVPTTWSGAGVSIGIVGRSRTNFADFASFRSKTGSTFADPTEIVPTDYGGVDPGPAFTAPPTSGGTGDQGEATLDVVRAGSVAPGAALLLVVATAASGGIYADAQYLVNTSPVPVQVMTISYGACEFSAGSTYVSYWDTLFQQAAAEGISVFISSGDSGASGCDSHGGSPPVSPLANSPNYICSSSYATCVGGTEFNDTATPSLYWNSTNFANYRSALGYIPEGGWNDPLNSSGGTQVLSSGGGVSRFIATPSWQTGTGVPAARAGRYTPDISFSASGHDGYFTCFAAGGGSCVSSGGSFSYMYFSGTSASAPDMAGVAALLDEKLGGGQGNWNPKIYQMAGSVPAAFHDTTPATSGVTTCDINTPSMCNNSIPGTSGLTGGQAGFPVTVGYDEVTGWGSLDVSIFLDNFPNGTTPAPTLSMTCPAVVYDGSAHACSPSATGIGGVAVAGSFSCVPGSRTNAGSYPETCTFTSYSPNYVGGWTVTGTLNIVPATPVLAVNCPAATYDGAAHSCSGTATGIGGVSVSGSFLFNPANAVNAGTYGETGTFTSSNGNYASGGQAGGSLVISPAAPVVGVSCGEFVYDGNPHSCTAAATGVGGATVNGSFNFSPASLTNVTAGTTVTATFTSSNSNYSSGGTATGTLKIDPATPALTLTCSEVTYDGAAHACSASASGVGGTAVAGTFLLNPASLTNVTSGTTVTATFTSSNANYASGGTATGTLKIDAAIPTLLLTCAEVTYDGTAHSCSGAATGLGGATVSGSFSLSPVSRANVTAGTTVTGTFTSSNANYASGGTATDTLKIDPATPTLTLSCVEVTYDGTAHTCTGSAKGVGGATVAGSFVLNPAGVTNATTGTSIASTFISADTNYVSGGAATGMLKIDPAAPTVTLTCPPVKNDGMAHSCTATATGAGGASVAGTLSIVPGSEMAIGNYPEQVTFVSADANYTNGSASGSLVIWVGSAQISPVSYGFGSEPVSNSSRIQAFTLRNTGNGPLAISGIAVSSGFVQSNNCPASLAAGAHCAIGVTFHPNTAGAQSGTLTITSDSNSAVSPVTLTGTGTLPGAALSPSSLTFATQRVGTPSVVQNVTLTNTGAAPLAITNFRSTGDFQLTNHCPHLLSAGGSCQIGVAFVPTARGVRTGSLALLSNAPQAPGAVTFSGSGIAAVATLSPGTLNFSGGTAMRTTSTAQNLTVTNNGDAPLTVTRVSVSGHFTQTNTCGGKIAPGGSCAIAVTFAPLLLGPQGGVLSVTDNAINSTQQTASLSGTGTDFSVSGAPVSATVTAGDSANYIITLGVVDGAYNAPVTLSCSGLPAGAACGFSPATVTPGAAGDTSALQITTSASTPAGSYSVVVTALSSTGTRHVSSVGLTVQ